MASVTDYFQTRRESLEREAVTEVAVLQILSRDEPEDGHEHVFTSPRDYSIRGTRGVLSLDWVLVAWLEAIRLRVFRLRFLRA